MIKPFEIPCVILCGGKSSRMGEDKALLPFKNYNSLAIYQLEKFKPYFKDIYFSSKTNKFDFDANIIYDESEMYSPLTAIKTIIEKLNKPVFIISVDTPLISIETIEKLYDEFINNNYECVYVKTDFPHYLCAIYSPNILDKINTQLQADIHKIGYLVKAINSKSIVSKNEQEFTNLNTKEYLNTLNI